MKACRPFATRARLVFAGLVACWCLGCPQPRLDDTEGAEPSLVTVGATLQIYTPDGRSQDPSEDPITIGDRLLYSLEVSAAPAVELQPIELGARHGDLPVVERLETRERREGARVVRTERWLLRVERVGTATVPAVTIRYTPPPTRTGDDDDLESTAAAKSERATPSSAEGAMVEVSSESLTVEVASVLPADVASVEIRDVKPLRAPREWLLPALATVAAVVGLGALAFWLLRRRRARWQNGPDESLPFDLLALRDLERLKPWADMDPDAARRLAFEMSEVLRRYVEARFAFNATDLTTEEILSSLGTQLTLTVADRELLEGFLGDLDPVKYAGRPAARLLLERAHERARRFVVSTRLSAAGNVVGAVGSGAAAPSLAAREGTAVAGAEIADRVGRGLEDGRPRAESTPAPDTRRPA